jgi:TPP-dependent pyruvate/acetoin dehydrogenase alpha subunit
MTAKSTGEAGENPLVPNAKLRQMYTKMLEARMLEEAVRKRATAKGNKRIATIRGQEAVRVSTTIELMEDDLVSDTEPTAGMGLLLGGDGASLLRGFTRGKSEHDKVLLEAGVSRALRGSKEEEERLRLSMGAALALKTQVRKGIVVAYSRKGELAPAAWRRVLVPAVELDLPILFVLLGRRASQKKGAERAEVCNAARAAGMPAIPVDACDAVALYRVTQESLGRTRGGDGPVLIETVRWRVEGTRGGVDDPLEHLKEFLVDRKICSAAWFEQIGKTTRRRLTSK